MSKSLNSTKSLNNMNLFLVVPESPWHAPTPILLTAHSIVSLTNDWYECPSNSSIQSLLVNAFCSVYCKYVGSLGEGY